MTAVRIDDVVSLADGRRLAYAEYGDAEGKPMLLFHGLPGSRLSWGFLPHWPMHCTSTNSPCSAFRAAGQGRYLSDTIPDSEAILVADSGHLWILLHLNEVLTALAGD